MKKIFLLLFVVISINSQAQLMHFSFGGHWYKQKGVLLEGYDPGTAAGTVYYGTVVDENSAVPGIGFYYYKHFYNPSDAFSVGLQSGFDFWAFYEAPTEVQNQYGQKVGEEGGSALVIGYTIPLYAMARFGSQATEDLGDGLSVAFGAGINVMGFNVVNDEGFMVPFAIAAELSYRKVGLRLDLPFKDFESHYPSYTGDIPRMTTSFFSVELTIALGED